MIGMKIKNERGETIMIENDIEALDIAYVSSFATRVERRWGYLFYNENQPNYYDANHATSLHTMVISKRSSMK